MVSFKHTLDFTRLRSRSVFQLGPQALAGQMVAYGARLARPPDRYG